MNIKATNQPITIIPLHCPDAAKGVTGVWIQIQATENSQKTHNPVLNIPIVCNRNTDCTQCY